MTGAAGAAGLAAARGGRAPARWPRRSARRSRGRRRRRLRRPAPVPPAAARTARPTTSSPRPATATPSARSSSSPTTTPPTAALVFAPQLTTVPADAFPDWYERQETSPPGDAARGGRAGAGGARRADRAAARCGGSARSSRSASAATFADIASRTVVPGANDNLSGVAVRARAGPRAARAPGRRACACCSSRPARRSRSWRACAASRAATSARCRRERTEVVCLDSVGSPELILIEGEGMLRMRDYTPELRDRLAAVAARAGVHLRRGLRLGLRHRRPDRAQGRLPRAPRSGRSRSTSSRSTTTTQRDTADALVLRDGPRRGRALRGARAHGDVSRLSAAQLAGAARRPPRACRSRRRSGPPRGLASSSPSSRARADAELGGELVAGDERRRRARVAPARTRAPSIVARELEVGGDRRLGLAAAGGQPVGDGQQRHVGRVRRGRAPGSARRRGAVSGRSWTRKPSSRWWRVSAAT